MWFSHPNALDKIEYVLNDFSREVHKAKRLVEGNIDKYIRANAPANAVLYRYGTVSSPGLRPGTWKHIITGEYVSNRFVDTILDGDNYVVPVAPEEIPTYFDNDKALALLALHALER